ncbi:MAG: PA4642 family protein [Pseudomonadales bacterium]
MATRPDKKEVIDEIWDEARIDDFIHKAPLAPGEDPDFSALVYAYRSMRPADFTRFMTRFVAAGRNPSARGRQGQTLRTVITPHRQAAPFLDVLSAHGA